MNRNQVHLSRPMRKPTICICETKGADQLCSNCEADQRLCFCYNTDSEFFYFLNQSFQPLNIFFACTAQFVSDLFGNRIVGFLMRRLIFRVRSRVNKNRLNNPRYFILSWSTHNQHSIIIIIIIIIIIKTTTT